MGEFTPINTQEEFDDRIKDRLRRERDKFADYEDIKTQLADANSKIADLEAAVAAKETAYNTLLEQSNEKDSRIAGFEADALRTTVAINKKLPMNLRPYLQGTTEEELNASADVLIAAGVGQQVLVPPLAQVDPEPPADDFATTGKVNAERAMREFAESLKVIDE